MEGLKMHNVATALLQGVTEIKPGVVSATAANGRIWPLLTAIDALRQTAWLGLIARNIIEEQKIANKKPLTHSATACNAIAPLIPLGSDDPIISASFMSSEDDYLIFAQLSAQSLTFLLPEHAFALVLTPAPGFAARAKVAYWKGGGRRCPSR